MRKVFNWPLGLLLPQRIISQQVVFRSNDHQCVDRRDSAITAKLRKEVNEV